VNAQMQMQIQRILPREVRRCPSCEWGRSHYERGQYVALCYHSGASPQVEGVGSLVNPHKAIACPYWQLDRWRWHGDTETS